MIFIQTQNELVKVDVQELEEIIVTKSGLLIQFNNREKIITTNEPEKIIQQISKRLNYDSVTIVKA